MALIDNIQVTPPSAPGWRSVGLRLRSAVAVSQSPFTFKEQRYTYPGQQYIAELELPPMSLDNARTWAAFFRKMNGREGSFLLALSNNITGTRADASQTVLSKTGGVSSVNTSTNEITLSSSNVFLDDDQVEVVSTGDMIGGTTAGTPYFVEVVSATVIKLHTDVGGASEVNLTDAGSGTITVEALNAYGFLISNNWPTSQQVLWAGDIISIASQMMTVLEDVTSDGSGICRIIHDRKFISFLGGTGIETAERATGEFRLEESPLMTIGVERLLHGINFRAFEVI